MKYSLSYAVAGAALLLLSAGASAPSQTNGQLFGTGHITEVTAPELAGTYRITEVTELGPQLVKLSLELHLTNRSTESVELSSLAFHPMHPVPAGQNSASLRMQPLLRCSNCRQ